MPFIFGDVDPESLEQNGVTVLKKSLGIAGMTDKGALIKCDVLHLEISRPDGHHDSTELLIGQDDGLLHNITVTHDDGSLITEGHTNIQVGGNAPKEYWTLDFPLMGEAAKVVAPAPLDMKSNPDVALQLPTIDALDASGHPLCVSPENQKAVVFYLFDPRSARYIIDGIQRISEEGEVRGVQFVGVMNEHRRDKVEAFIAQHKVTFPIYFDEQPGLSSLARQLGMRISDAFLIYGTDGKLKSNAPLRDED